MEKYQGLTDITEHILHGHLNSCSIQYDNEKFICVHIEYNDDVFVYDYDMEIDKEHHTSLCTKHFCHNHGAQTDLNANNEFEHAVVDYLFHK